VIAAVHSTGRGGVVGLCSSLGCLVAAAVFAWRAAWVVVACLLVVAIIAAALLL
jgi:hypothetical protein